MNEDDPELVTKDSKSPITKHYGRYMRHYSSFYLNPETEPEFATVVVLPGN